MTSVSAGHGDRLIAVEPVARLLGRGSGEALVTCSRFENEDRVIPGVVVVFEVLSFTSGRVDRILKVREYAAAPSIRRYVILESTGASGTVMERTEPDGAWRTTVLTGDDMLRMPEIGIEIPVAAFYEDLIFPEEGQAVG